MSSVDWSSLTYAYFFVGTAVLWGLWKAFDHAVKTIVSASVEEICKRLDRIDYALYNEGKTGLVNKVELLLENQQEIKIDVEVIKAKSRNGFE